MRQLTFGLVARRVLIAAITALKFTVASAMAMNDLYLEVIVNDTPTGLIAAFQKKPDGGLMVARGELKELGIEAPADGSAGEALVDLDRFPGLTYRYDSAAQVVRIVVMDRLRVPYIYDAAVRRRAAPEPSSPVPGVLLNYLVHASSDVSTFTDILSDVNGGQVLAVALDGRAFTSWGLFSQSAIAGTSMSDRAPGSIRLDSTWSLSDPDTLLVYRAGDIISGGLAWTRSVRLGGVQVQRSFSLRPDLVTMPMPQLSGTAAVPSTVDVYVNNVRTFSQDVPSGPFELRNLPVVSGAGTQRIVVSDSLGREVVTNRPVYASAKLLRPGLLDFSAEAGVRRFNYGIESNDNEGGLLGSGSLRQGIYDWLTLESHVEGGAGLLNASGGATFPLSSYGVLSLGVGASSYQGDLGLLYAGSIELALGNAMLFARTQRTAGSYMDMGGLPGDLWPDGFFLIDSLLPPRELDQISLSFPIGWDPSTLTLSYTHLRTAQDDRYQIVSASMSRALDESWTASAAAFTDMADSGNSGLFFSLSRSFGQATSFSANVSTSAGSTSAGFDLIKQQPLEINTYGWRVREYEGDTPVRSASLSYRAPAARLEAGVDNVGSAVRARGEIEGAVAVLGGGVFLTNRIDDAFAVVDAGMPDVPVYYENRPVGRTNGQGQLLVPYLRSYDSNQIAIDPTNLPPDVDVAHTKQVVVPTERGSALVRFHVEVSPSAVVVLRDAVGAFVSPGSRGVLEATGESFVVGYDGQAYVKGLAGDNRISVELLDGSMCQARFPFALAAGARAEINNVVCR
jgi:outer membrane usher protein